MPIQIIKFKEGKKGGEALKSFTFNDEAEKKRTGQKDRESYWRERRRIRRESLQMPRQESFQKEVVVLLVNDSEKQLQIEKSLDFAVTASS